MVAKEKLVTVTHPTIADLSEDVPESDFDNWIAAGWLGPKKHQPSTDD